MKVYRGLHEDYDENFVRDFEEYHYCNCYSFWTPNKNYAKKFGEKIMSKDIDPKKFFDLEKDDPDDFAFLTGESIEPAEQNLEFAIFLTLNGYDGYTRIDSDDGSSTDENEREYVIINKNDKELHMKQNLLFKDPSSKEEIVLDGLRKLYKKRFGSYDGKYELLNFVHDYGSKYGLDGLLEVDALEGEIKILTKDMFEIMDKINFYINNNLKESILFENILKRNINDYRIVI